MRRLNVGAGQYPLKDFENYDLADFDIIKRWPFPDGCAEIVVMSHVLEHVTRHEAAIVLEEACRVLKPGGTLHVATPDMDKFIDCRVKGEYSPLGGYRWTDFNHFLGGDPENEGNEYQRHKYMYTYGSLQYALKMAGFSLILRVEAGEYDNPQYRPISLYVDAMK